MVSHKEDTINFDKLEEELDKAVQADAKYWRENDAKFRAVNQKVATYEEFKDIVAASHLKPLEKDDRLDKIDRFTQPWNIHAGSKDKDAAKTSGSNPLKKETQKVPSNGFEFAKEWRRHCKTNTDKFKYLLSLGGANLAKIFKAEISLGLLGDIIGALDSEYNQEKAKEIYCVLHSLSDVNRFVLSVQFLSEQEKKYASHIFDKLKTDLELDKDATEVLQQIMTKYEVKI